VTFEFQQQEPALINVIIGAIELVMARGGAKSHARAVFSPREGGYSVCFAISKTIVIENVASEPKLSPRVESAQ
jgi:hypothetical protein